MISALERATAKSAAPRTQIPIKALGGRHLRARPAIRIRLPVRDRQQLLCVAPVHVRPTECIVAYTCTPPLSMLAALTPDLFEVQTLAQQRQPATVQARLSEATAVLGLLSADALMKLGEVSRARYWYGTARLAADDTMNVELRARVRAQEAMLPYYYGRVEQTVSIARAAQALPHTACSAVALAAGCRGSRVGSARSSQADNGGPRC